MMLQVYYVYQPTYRNLDSIPSEDEADLVVEIY